MPIHEKTLKIYEETGFKFHLDAEDKAYAEWLTKVSDGKGGYNEPIEERVQSIHRIKDEKTNEEFIAWKGVWSGVQIHELTNTKRTLRFPTSGKGAVLTWMEPILDKGEPFYDECKRKVTYPPPQQIGQVTHYERKFSEKAFDELMKKADHSKKGGVNWVVYYANRSGIGGKSSPIAIHDRDTFVHGKFEDICKVQRVEVVSSSSQSTNTNTNITSAAGNTTTN